MITGLSAEQTETLTSINVFACAVSFAGSGFIVLCYLLFKELRKFSFQLVFYLSLSDLLCSFFNLLGDPGRGFLCYVQGYTTQFFSVASFLWTTTIAFTLHRTVVKHKTDVEELGPIFHLYVWGTSLILAIIPSIGNDYGQAGAWCWLQNETNAGKVVRFLTFYVPLWGAILFNGVVYFQVIRMLNYATRMAVEMSDRQRQVEVKADVKAMNRWGYYPLILIGSWAFGTINRIYDFVVPHEQLFWLYCLDVGTSALMGLFNSIAYGLNASVRRTLQEKTEQYWPEKLRWKRAGFMKLGEVQENELEQLDNQDNRHRKGLFPKPH